ncbi:hypothetical protein JCM11491_004110 [Sporobolomyces phaffii]
MSQTCSKLLQLPPEVLLHTLAFTSPRDCARLATLNRLLSVLCSTWTLHRDLLAQLADSPTSSAAEFPYQAICRRLVQVTAALDKMERGLPPPPDAELVPLLETLVYLAATRPVASVTSANETLLEKYLSPTSATIVSLHPTFSTCRQPRLRPRKCPDVVVSELVSRLHVLSTPSLVALGSPGVRTAAREIVYERLNFTRASGYGPLKSDGTGSVDYRKLEAISVVMSSNLDEAKTMGWGQEGGADEDETAVPSGWSSTRTGSATVETIEGQATDPRDWAGVTTHEWRGTYAFLHYPVYHSFNAHRTSTYVPSLADESEAVGDCMSLKLELLPEGEEVSPPMEAFGTTLAPNRNGPRGGGGTSDDDDDSDFDGDDDLDEDDTSAASASSDEDDVNTHFVTNRSHPRRQSPPTSPPDDTLPGPSVPPLLGPLPPPSASTSSEPFLATSTTPSPTAFPKLAFHGTSMPLQLRTLAFTGTFVNSQSHFNIRDRSIRGTVEMNAQGEIIWKYLIRYGGVDHWAMTGVQVGGPKSKFGVLGSWSCADRDAADDEGPNGPFWYWPNTTDA